MSDSVLDVLAPPRELLVENVRMATTAVLLHRHHYCHMLQVPPVPASMASDVGRFNDIRGHSLVDWRVGCSSSPLQLELLLCHRPGTNTSQLFRLQHEGGELLPVTHCSDDAVASGSYEPIHGDIIVFERSRGGSEEVH